jgi:hypothetical protein
MSPLTTIETQAGEPIQAGNLTMIPFVRSLRFQFPGGRSGGVIWTSPASLLVKNGDGQEQVLPIPDITRRIQLGLFGLCLGMLLLWILTSRMRKAR